MPPIDRLMQHSVYISNSCISFTVHFQCEIRIHIKHFNLEKKSVVIRIYFILFSYAM